jgi:S1-C subfamily serine protease
MAKLNRPWVRNTIVGLRRAALLVLLATMTVGIAPAQWEGKVSTNFLNSVVRIETAPDPAKRTATGTGFLVGLDPSKSGSPSRILLVTNKHMVGDWNLANGDVKDFRDWVTIYVYTTANAAGMSYAPVRIVLKDKMGVLIKGKVTLHKNPKVDIAIVRLDAEIAPFSLTVLPEDLLIPFGKILGFQTGLGDEVFALGYPFGIRSVKSGYPVAKVGHLASLPGEDFRLDTWAINRLGQKVAVSLDGKILIVDGLIVQGNSGGPVITAAGVRTLRDPESNKLMFSSKPVPNAVIGIVSSTLDGAGLAVVYATDYITELLHM